MTLPAVTILIPTYNRARFLPSVIQSALSQTYKNLETLVLDDASPDETPEVVREFLHDPRLRYIRHAKNMGIGANWKAGMEAMSGDYFCILHDDDTLEPQFVERLLSPLTADPDLILSFCDHWVMDAEGRRMPQETEEASRKFKRQGLPPGQLADFARAALVHASIPVGAALFRRNMVGPDMIRAEAKGGIDTWLCYQCVRTGQGAHYLPERLMNYRQHPGGMSGSLPFYMMEGHLFRFRAILNDPALSAIHASIREELASMLTAYAAHLLLENKGSEARQQLHEARAYRKTSPKAALLYALSFGGRSGAVLLAQLRRTRRA